MMLVVTKKQDKTFYLADNLDGFLDVTDHPVMIQAGQGLRDSQPTANIKSINGVQKVQVKFINQSYQQLKVNWIDHNGQQKTYCSLNNNGSWSVNTFASHPWAFVDNKGNVLKVLTVLYASKPSMYFIIKADQNKSIEFVEIDQE